MPCGGNCKDCTCAAGQCGAGKTCAADCKCPCTQGEETKAACGCAKK